MTEVKGRDADPRPVTVALSFAEALTGVAALQDYVNIRRSHGQGEDAILAYLYRALMAALREAAREDPDGFAAAEALVQVPDMLRGAGSEEGPDGT